MTTILNPIAMTPRSEPRRRRNTPISASLGADLHTLGSLLANHTRGLDAYLQRQANRVEQRYQGILADADGFLLPPDLNLDAMTLGELQSLCRSKRLRGWSKLRRDDLLVFVKDKLGREIEIMRLLHKDALIEASPAESSVDAAGPQADQSVRSAWAADATRTERLLLLLLQHLNVPLEKIEAIWQDPDVN